MASRNAIKPSRVSPIAPAPAEPVALENPSKLLPLDGDTTPIVLKLTGDLKRAYESIAKISGINVIFDADLGNKLTTQVPVDLNNVTVIEGAVNSTPALSPSLCEFFRSSMRLWLS